MSEPTPKHEPVTPTVQIGSFRPTGAPAVVVLLGILGAILATVIRFGPRWSWSNLWLSALLWLAFIVYWSAAVKDSAPALSSESSGSRQLHTLLLNLSLVLLFLPLPGLGARWLPRAPWIEWAGLGVQALFFLLAIWARRCLGRNWSGEVSVRQDHRLVRSGPYRFVRHPIYAAMLGMYLGTALVSGRLHGLTALLLVAVAYARKIPLEERTLLGNFGPAYEEYRQRSWALVPGVF
jgi:protein-S-isoprenylcysteine O-methyltransferase Ste14